MSNKGTRFQKGQSGNSKLSTESRKEFVKRIIEKQIRMALTSGGNEPPADAIKSGKHSVCAKTFINIPKNNDEAL